jgi:hypothetical protein
VTQLDADAVELDLIRQTLQPLEVRLAEHGGVDVERVTRRLVVVGIVHPAGDGRVMVAEDRRLGDVTNDLRALVRRATVTDGVPQAVVSVDLLARVRFQNGAQGFVIGVDVA